MAFDVYFKEDILNVLRSVYAANEGASGLALELLQDPELREVGVVKLMQVYRRGFVTALGAVGLAFGLDALPFPPASCALLPDLQPPKETAVGRQAEWSEARLIGFLWQAVGQERDG